MPALSNCAGSGLAALALTFTIMTGNAYGETVYTGDTIGGIKVISRLDMSDLEAGKKHRFLFQGIQMATGQHWYVPVMVAKGAKPGKKILIGAGVHGDELSPLDVAQRAFAELDPASMSGTVLAVLDMSRPAKEFVQRKWPTPISGGSLIDMNRVWPGNDTRDITYRHAHLIWNNLFKGNVEAALDFHTAATGADFAFFIFADLRNPEVRQLAELFPVQQIKDDPGLEGTLETAFVKAGIPAITVEVGGPRIFDAPKIHGSVEGVRNVLLHYGMTAGKMGRTAKDSQAFFGNDLEVIRSSTGGFVELLVKLGDKVKIGQKLAIQRNSFGDTLEVFTSGVDGEVAILGTDALREPGARLMEILVNRTDQKCANGGCPYAGEDY
jgi:predicted deacylase